jgi:hypothetical protein
VHRMKLDPQTSEGKILAQLARNGGSVAARNGLVARHLRRPSPRARTTSRTSVRRPIGLPDTDFEMLPIRRTCSDS